MHTFKRSLFIAIAISMSAVAAQARYACELVFQVQTPAVLKVVEEDAFQQWLKWEQTANFQPFHKTTAAFRLPVTKAPVSEVRIEIDNDVPADFLKYVQGDGQNIEWFKHPHNTADIVPYLNKPATSSVEAYYTASRSIALGGKFRGLTVKLGTDRPHGPQGQHQPGKADTADDVRSALLHTAHLKRMDKELGKDPEFLMLPEVMTVSDKVSKVGYVVRDVRAMDSGHYYLPALSIPYVGREIAKLNGENFESFWQKNYAELLGRAKARMLLRYGLQMETPNSQNMLIQLDRNLKPTGRIFFRDISDALYVDVVGRGLGFEKEIQADIGETFDPHTYIKPFWSNSSWRFNEAGEKSVSNIVLLEWGIAHNKAYHEYLQKELEVQVPMMSGNSDENLGLYQFLGSAEGQAALKAYRQKNMAKSLQ